MLEKKLMTQGMCSHSKPWRFTSRSIAFRLFISCWLVYTLHFATNTVREIYLALAIGDHFSFRVDEYAQMHPDIFEKEGYGWHIGSNPGISMLAAIPYALSRPITDRIVDNVNQKRTERGLRKPPEYDSPWPMAKEFYRKAWRRGYDVKFGLAAFVMQSLCMAPSSALGVVVIFLVLRRLFKSDKTALLLALLYAFGTPVFFRTGYINHNLMLGHIAFMGFVAMWNPENSGRLTSRTRFFLGGLSGGATVLFDYSGLIFLFGLFLYGFIKRIKASSSADKLRHACWYILGAVGPVCLLWYYQWKSFGHPFYPGQHWMPPVEWIELGYQGVGLPQFELLMALALDYRFGLFITCPFMMLALISPFINRGSKSLLPTLELTWLLLFFMAFWVFFSGINYTRLQFNTGIRYMAPIFPFLFVPAVIVLMRFPRRVIYVVGILSVMESWSLAMYRDVERGLGVLDPILHIMIGGFKLPALTVLSRMSGEYGDYFSTGVSPLPLFLLVGALLCTVWIHKSPTVDTASKKTKTISVNEGHSNFSKKKAPMIRDNVYEEMSHGR
jgi:hypothetical protein